MNHRKRQSILLVIIIVSFATFFTINVIRSNEEEKKLKANPCFSIAKIINAYYNIGKGSDGIHVDYEFYHENKKITGHEIYYGTGPKKKYFLNKSFPVIYLKEDPTINQIMIVWQEYEKYNLPQPDSLMKYNNRIR